MRNYRILFWAFLAGSTALAGNYKYDCTLHVQGSDGILQGEIAFDGMGATGALKLGDYTLSVHKTNGIGGVDSMRIEIKSVRGDITGVIVPMGTPWAVAAVNPIGTTRIVQANCKLNR
jgi:hypothetical protein